MLREIPACRGETPTGVFTVLEKAEEHYSSELEDAAPARSSAVTSILLSRADKRIYVLQNGNIVADGDANIKDPGEGDRLQRVHLAGEGMGFHANEEGATAPNTVVLERIEGSPDVMDAIRKRMKPGIVLVTTDLPATANARSGENFVVMDGPGK